MSQDLALERIDKARALLAEAKSMPEIKHVIDMASAAELYAKRQKLSDEAIGYAHEICVYAKAKLARMLAKAPKAKGGEHGGRKSKDGGRNPPSNPTPTLSSLGIDKDTAKELRAIADLDDQQVKAVASRKMTVRQVKADRATKKKAEDLARPVLIDMPEGIHRGDFREWSKDIPDNSVDLVFIDPPYDRGAIPLFEGAAEVAARILKPGASLISYAGHSILPDVYAGMSKHLRYWWTCACVHEGGNALLDMLGLRAGWKPLVWYVKGTRGDIQNIIVDTVRGDREKFAHEWQQSQNEAEYFIDKLCAPNGLVVDFFLGGGTTAAAAKKLGRRFIGGEINAASLERAVKRIAA